MEILIGIACGVVVSVFSMWAFLRGIKAGVQMGNKEIPEQIKNPVQAITEGIRDIQDDALSAKLKSKEINVKMNLIDYMGDND